MCIHIAVSQPKLGGRVVLESRVCLPREESKNQLCLNQANREQKAGDDQQFILCRMSHRLSRKDNHGQQEQDYRDSPVKAAQFRFDPGIQVTFEQSPLV